MKAEKITKPTYKIELTEEEALTLWGILGSCNKSMTRELTEATAKVPFLIAGKRLAKVGLDEKQNCVQEIYNGLCLVLE